MKQTTGYRRTFRRGAVAGVCCVNLPCCGNCWFFFLFSFCAQGVGVEERDAGGHVCVHVPETYCGSWDTGPPAAPPERGGLLRGPAARAGEREERGSVIMLSD